MPKISDIQEYVFDNIYRFANRLVKKNDKALFFVPSENCINDHYDIFNYRSDNVLCLFHALVDNNKYADYDLYLVYYNQDRYLEYIEYCEKNVACHVTLIHYKDSNAIARHMMRCRLIFTDNFYHYFRFKTVEQKVICLSYYPAPFKDDFWKIEQLGGIPQYVKKFQRMNRYYDYHIAASELTSILLSRDSLIHSSKFEITGFPRDDIFYRDNQDIKKKMLDYIGFPTARIFCYVPTHRDYESSLRQFYDESSQVKRSIFGNVTTEELKFLDDTLEKENAVIIAKIHPSQAKSMLDEGNFRRVFLFYDIAEHLRYSLQELLAISDFMITDYTSAVYDFMHVDRPIIYYFYDYSKYEGTRGFFVNPISSFCAGNLTYTISELVDAMMSLLAGKDDYKEKRRVISDILIKNKDGNSTNRVIENFINKTCFEL